MSKTIEQLAKEHCFGVNSYNQFGLSNFQAQYTFTADQLEAFAKAYAQTQGQSIPDGWKLVPIEPTWEMIAAPFEGKVEDQDMMAQKRRRDAMADNYRAMINAAPVNNGDI